MVWTSFNFPLFFTRENYLVFSEYNQTIHPFARIIDPTMIKDENIFQNCTLQMPILANPISQSCFHLRDLFVNYWESPTLPGFPWIMQFMSHDHLSYLKMSFEIELALLNFNMILELPLVAQVCWWVWLPMEGGFLVLLYIYIYIK